LVDSHITRLLHFFGGSERTIPWLADEVLLTQRSSVRPHQIERGGPTISHEIVLATRSKVSIVLHAFILLLFDDDPRPQHRWANRALKGKAMRKIRICSAAIGL
jgi:hypothetical protein